MSTTHFRLFLSPLMLCEKSWKLFTRSFTSAFTSLMFLLVSPDSELPPFSYTGCNVCWLSWILQMKSRSKWIYGEIEKIMYTNVKEFLFSFNLKTFSSNFSFTLNKNIFTPCCTRYQHLNKNTKIIFLFMCISQM